ncbi:uncharacterized protein LOC107845508 [Capsicum annuum]|uniref:uncharacterized protein LOC107845508 n=1 Tax=Capsicum annuum TaxID=4072 RepID=UPI0007BF9720|nr:uncharacterized protein LOC107845508 [Capsicum annuum]
MPSKNRPSNSKQKLYPESLSKEGLKGVGSYYYEEKRVPDILMFDYHRQHEIGISTNRQPISGYCFPLQIFQVDDLIQLMEGDNTRSVNIENQCKLPVELALGKSLNFLRM